MPDPAADEPPAADEEALPAFDEAADDEAEDDEDDELHAAKTTAQTAKAPMATGRRNARTIRPDPNRRVSRKPEWPPFAAPVLAPLAARWMAIAGSGTPPGASPATAPVARVVRTAGTLIER